MFHIDSTCHKNLFFSLILSLAVGAAAFGSDAPCDEALPLTLDATWRGPADAVGAEHCLEIDVPARGILTLDLSAPGAESRAVLVPVGGAYVERTATSVIVAAPRAGTYRFRVAAEDDRQALPHYKARVGFVELARTKDEDNGEIELDPDPLAYCGGPSLKDEDNGEIELDPDPLVHCALDSAGAPALLAAKLAALCRRGEVDDHGDVALCATPLALNEAASGEIGNGRGDDEDVFRFRLSELRTVEIASTGAADTFGELYDRFGHRLGSDDGDGGFRIVRTLSPGKYFVRVSGRHGAEGSYSLAVAALR